MKKSRLIVLLSLLFAAVACSAPFGFRSGPVAIEEVATDLPTATVLLPPPTSTPLPPTEPSPPTEAPTQQEEPETEEPVAADEDEADQQPTFVYSMEVRGLMAADSNFRTGPNLEADVIRQLQGGLPVYLQGRNGAATWVQIVPSASEEVGWVAFSQVEAVSDERAIALPVAQGQTLPDIPVGFSTNLDSTPAPSVPPTPIPTVEQDGAPEDTSDTSEQEDEAKAAENDNSPALPNGLQYDVDLLRNGSFEQLYQPWELLDGGGLVANQWEPWWYNDDGDVYEAPEYTMANANADSRRVVSGEDAQQYFRSCARHEAGVRQQVIGLAAGLTLRFTVYGHAWSTDADEPNPENSTDGGSTGDVIMKVGIDPTGGNDGQSDDVIWGQETSVYDEYELFTVEAQTTGDTVTVFTYSSPSRPVCTNYVYWDDARLEIIS